MSIINNFKFVHKTKVCSPVDGICIDISEVDNDVFSSKMLGDGFAIIPNGNIICAPCTGLLLMVFPTGHAFGIKTEDSIEILTHIGIDTVELNGKGFKILKKPYSNVKVGDPIIEIDKEFIESKGYNDNIVVIVTSNDKRKIVKDKIGEEVKKGEGIISFDK